MPYAAPDRATLRTALARDLRDPDSNTFTVDELNDLLNAAVVEVGRTYSKEDVVEFAVTQDYQNVFATEAYSLFRVEIIYESKVIFPVPQNNEPDHAESGWDLHGGALYLPKYVTEALVFEDGKTIRMWGYWPRELFTDDGDILDGDAETEFAVRLVSVLNGYQRLQNDRLLFQQWLTNTGNTDVSPNQLAQTADMYQGQWREMRNRLRTLQRT